MAEHEIQNSIRLALSDLGYVTFRVNVGKVKMADGRWFDTGLPKGFSDLIAIKDGKIAFLEVKTETGKPTQEQVNFIKQMRSRGCVAGIVRSVGDAVNLLGGVDNEEKRLS